MKTTMCKTDDIFSGRFVTQSSHAANPVCFTLVKNSNT